MKLYPLALTSPHISQLVHHITSASTPPRARRFTLPAPLETAATLRSFSTFIKSPARPYACPCDYDRWIGRNLGKITESGARPPPAICRPISVIPANFHRLFPRTTRDILAAGWHALAAERARIIAFVGAKNKYEPELAGVHGKYRERRRGLGRAVVSSPSCARRYQNKWCYRQNEIKALARSLFMPATTHRPRQIAVANGSPRGVGGGAKSIVIISV